jgi:hypothetical protein
MDSVAGMAAGVILAAVIFGIVMTVCWTILPFAVIGTKPLLRQLLAEQRRTNDLLQAMSERSTQEPTLPLISTGPPDF